MKEKTYQSYANYQQDIGVKSSTPGERMKPFPMPEAYIDDCEIVFKDFKISIKDFEISIKKIEDEMKKTVVKIND